MIFDNTLFLKRTCGCLLAYCPTILFTFIPGYLSYFICFVYIIFPIQVVQLRRAPCASSQAPTLSRKTRTSTKWQGGCKLMVIKEIVGSRPSWDPRRKCEVLAVSTKAFAPFKSSRASGWWGVGRGAEGSSIANGASAAASKLTRQINQLWSIALSHS